MRKKKEDFGIKQIDSTKRRKGWVTEDGDEIEICLHCGLKGARAISEGKYLYFHQGIEDTTDNTIVVTDWCEVPWSLEALEIVK